jgi:hypothetical protein
MAHIPAMRLALLGLLALAACDPGDRHHDATPDAADLDEHACVDGTQYMPVGAPCRRRQAR